VYIVKTEMISAWRFEDIIKAKAGHAACLPQAFLLVSNVILLVGYFVQVHPLAPDPVEGGQLGRVVLALGVSD
jgi:hypothetical protein